MTSLSTVVVIIVSIIVGHLVLNRKRYEIDSNEDGILMIGIMSSRYNFEQRQAIRDTWMKRKPVMNLKFDIKFVVGSDDCDVHQMDRFPDPFSCEERRIHPLSSEGDTQLTAHDVEHVMKWHPTDDEPSVAVEFKVAYDVLVTKMGYIQLGGTTCTRISLYDRETGHVLMRIQLNQTTLHPLSAHSSVPPSSSSSSCSRHDGREEHQGVANEGKDSCFGHEDEKTPFIVYQSLPEPVLLRGSLTGLLTLDCTRNDGSSPSGSQSAPCPCLHGGEDGSIRSPDDRKNPNLKKDGTRIDPSFGLIRFLKVYTSNPMLDEGSIGIPHSFHHQLLPTFSFEPAEGMTLMSYHQKERKRSWIQQNERLKEQLLSESDQHQDILFIPSLVDVYRNLPLKLLGLIKWSREHRKCKYLFKTDDDCYVHLDRLMDILSSAVVTPNSWWANFRKMWAVNLQGKWKEEDFMSASYPPFPCGSGYLMGFQVMEWLYHNGDHLHLFQGEDTSLGIWLSAIHPNRIDCPSFRCWEPGQEGEKEKRKWLETGDKWRKYPFRDSFLSLPDLSPHQMNILHSILMDTEFSSSHPRLQPIPKSTPSVNPS